MANTPPNAAIHSGMLTGRFSASSSPVTTADISEIVIFFFQSQPNNNSVNTVLAMVTAMTASALGPKL